MEEVYDDIVGTYENAINYLEHLFDQAEDNLDYGYMRDNLKKQMDYYVKIQETAVEQLKYLAEKGYDIASDEAQKWVDVFYEAGQAIKEISRQIAADILDPFDDFIDLADKFDIWEYMDFTKVDYLRDKLTALNKLFEEGTITAKQYNEELKSLSYAIYDAQKELFQKQQDEIEKAAQETIKAYNEQIKLLNKQKDSINDYYDELIKGYNKEIEAWEKRKEEVSDYYDTLIDNLRDVEKANERINKQVDYYNERQKIITNLEQAQARSGVEWREKEIEYQQQLIDLDENWRRTLEEWSIEDQIAALESLKETTLKDIELSIQAIRDTITAAQEAKQAALDAIDAEIEGIQEMIETVEKETEEAVQAIEEQIKDMSRTIAESIKNGVEDGLVDSKEELDKALVDGTNALLNFIDSNGKAMEDGVKEASANSYALYTAEFLKPYSDSVTEIASGMKDALAVGATEGAKEALSAFMTGFIDPLKNEMANILKQSETAKANISSASYASPGGSGSSGTSSSASSSKKSTGSSFSMDNTGTKSTATPTIKDTFLGTNQWDKFKNPQNYIYITNYNSSVERAASRNADILQKILGY